MATVEARFLNMHEIGFVFSLSLSPLFIPSGCHLVLYHLSLFVSSSSAGMKLEPVQN